MPGLSSIGYYEYHRCVKFHCGSNYVYQNKQYNDKINLVKTEAQRDGKVEGRIIPLMS